MAPRLPQERKPDQDSSPSHLKIVAGVAFTMVAFSIGMRAARGIAFRANLGLGKAAVKLTQKGGLLEGMRKIATKHSATKVASRMHKASNTIQRMASRIKASGTSTLDAERAHISASRMFTDPVFKRTNVLDYRLTRMMAETKVLKNSSLMNFAKRAASYDKKYLQSQGGVRLNTFAGLKKTLTPQQLRDARFGGKDFGKVMQGRMHRWGSDFLAGAPIMYAIDKARGYDSQRKWYDPRSMGAWATEMAPMDLAFQGLLPVSKAITTGSGRVAMKALGKSGSENLMANTLNFLTKVDKTTGHVTEGFARAFTNAARATDGGTIRKPIRTLSNFIKTSKVFGGELSKTPGRIARNWGREKARPSPLDRALGRLEEAKTAIKRGPSISDDGLDLQAIRKANLREFEDDPGGFSAMINKITALSDEKVSMIKHSKQRVEPGSNGMMFRGRGMLSCKGKSYDFHNIHPTAIKQGFARIMGKHAPGFLGMRQLALSAQREKMAIASSGQDINLNVKYNPEEVIGDDNLSMFLDGVDAKSSTSQRRDIIGNLMEGKYTLKKNEKALYLDDRLWLIQSHGEHGKPRVQRLGKIGGDQRGETFAKYAGIPMESAGNWSTVIEKTFTGANLKK